MNNLSLNTYVYKEMFTKKVSKFPAFLFTNFFNVSNRTELSYRGGEATDAWSAKSQQIRFLSFKFQLHFRTVANKKNERSLL